MMQLSDLKRALFGYKKDDVYKYFADLNAEYSVRMQKMEGASEKRIAELEEKNTQLEMRIAALESENEGYKNNEAAVSASIIAAKKFAEAQQAETEKTVAEQRVELARQFGAARSKAQLLLDSVAGCKETIAAELMKIQSDLTETEAAVTEVVQTIDADLENLEDAAQGEMLTLFSVNRG